MYLEKIAIKNFKAIENMTLEFDTGVNVASVDKGIQNKTTKYGLPTY